MRGSIRSLALGSLALWVAAQGGLAWGQGCGAAGIQIEFDPPIPAPGQPVTVRARNVTSQCHYVVPSGCLYVKIGAPGCVAPFVVPFRQCELTPQPLPPGGVVEDTWDQKDWLGQPVGPGTYAFQIQVDDPSGTTLTLCAELHIPSCPTPPEHYGAGNPGQGALAPAFSIQTVPQVGGVLDFTVTNALGGAAGWLAVGAGRAQIPMPFGTFLLDPNLPLFFLPIAYGGTPGQSGAGSATFVAPVPGDPALVGLKADFQAFVQDPASSGGFSHTEGLEITICP